MSNFRGFPKDTLKFLAELADNNSREWFAVNKERYEASFVAPSLALIESLKKPLEKIAPLLRVEAKKMGGSLMRIYKDTRFSNDKTPYKTNIGIQFRHQSENDVHGPGIYIHIANDECFVGAGLWKPASEALFKIRNTIVDSPQGWRKAKGTKAFTAFYSLYDDRLKSAPRGFPKDHPQIEDLRLRSFLGSAPLTRSQVQSDQLVDLIVARVRAASPLMAYLCEAIELPY